MGRRVVDLTFPIHEGMTTFPVPWHPVVEISILGRHGIENRETRKITLGTHTGTHCDAPRHFVPGGISVDELSLYILTGPAYVLNFSLLAELSEINSHDLELALGENRPERLVLRFDWCRKWGTMEYYSEHPYLTEEAGEWLVARGIRLIAMDTPMPDNPKNGRGTVNDSPLHKIFLKHGVIIVEYLCNLKELTQENIELIVLPLKIAGADGAPVRCIAYEFDGKD